MSNELMQEKLISGTIETLIMVFVSTSGAILLGLIPAILLVLTKKGGLKENKFVFGVLDFIVNTLRSFPFIILLVVLIPFTRLIVGQSFEMRGFLLPLTIAASPFVARIIEGALNEVSNGVVESAKSFGASNMQIVRKVMFREAVPQLTIGLTTATIVILGYTAMAGAVSGGGLGQLAIKQGYERGNDLLLWICVIILIIMVQIIQSIGNLVYRIIKR